MLLILFVIYYLLFVICYLLFVFCYLLFIICYYKYKLMDYVNKKPLKLNMNYNLLIFTVIVIILTLSSAVVSQLGLFHLNISKITSIIIIHGNVLLVLPKPQQHAWHMFQVNQKSCKHWY